MKWGFSGNIEIRLLAFDKLLVLQSHSISQEVKMVQK